MTRPPLLPLAALSLAMLSSAEAQSPSLARQVADGQPWSMRRADGGQSRVTLNPDGSARVQVGILTMDASWREAPDGMCLRPSVAAERCVTLRRVANAVIGMREGREEFRLTR